jgi:hypothetical protein
MQNKEIEETLKVPLKFKDFKPHHLNLSCNTFLNVTQVIPDSHLQIQSPFPARKRPSTAKNTKKKIRGTTPVPEFASEYLYKPYRFKKNTKSSFLDPKKSSNQKTSNSLPPKKIKIVKKTLKKRPQSTKNSEKEPALNQILRLFKPQVQNLSEKNNFKVFPTVSIGVKRSKANLLRHLKILSRHKPSLELPTYEKITLKEEKIQEIKDFKGYSKPAETFGDKLWRLNEVSVINILELNK